MKLYRYISESKINMLESRDSKPISLGLTILGSGLQLAQKTNQPIRYRLEKVIKNLNKENCIKDITTRNSNFIAGQLQFNEGLMNGVAIWVAIKDDTAIVLGGSARFLNFDHFTTNESWPQSGSNRTHCLRELTNFWRSIIPKSYKEKYENQPSIFNVLSKDKIQSDKIDETPRSQIQSGNNLHNGDLFFAYTAARDVNMFYDDSLVDNLEFVAIVYSDHIIQVGDYQGESIIGKRIIIGSPIYIAQISPSGK